MTAFCYGYDCSRWCLWQAVQSVYGSDYDSVVSRADDVRQATPPCSCMSHTEKVERHLGERAAMNLLD